MILLNAFIVAIAAALTVLCARSLAIAARTRTLLPAYARRRRKPRAYLNLDRTRRR